jgi:KDO2-lipid IV(A) lauroyltransferase
MPRTPFQEYLRRRRHDVGYAAALGMKALATLLPRRVGLCLFGGLGLCAWMLAASDRRRARSNLRLIYGAQWAERRIRATTRQVFVELARNLYDTIKLREMSDVALDAIVSCENFEVFRDIDRAHRGYIVITSHSGCFEMQVPYVARKGFSTVVIGQRLFDERLDKHVRRARTVGDIIYLQRGVNPRTIVRHVLAGRGFAALIDQDTDVDGVFAHFMGRLAYTPSGPVKLAMRLGVPLLVVTTARQKDDTHRMFVRGPVELRTTSDHDADLVANVEKVNELLCDTIRAYPEQWVWMHRRWRRKPTDAGYEQVPSMEG